MRSRSMRAFMRRISRRQSSGNGSRYTNCRARARGTRAPSSASPATTRALVSAWNSHVCAHCSKYASVARRANGRAGPACLRGAGGRRRGTSGPPTSLSPIARDEPRRRSARRGRSRRAVGRRTRRSRRCRTRTTARCPPRRPRPITANGSAGSSDRSAASTHASARFDSSRPTRRRDRRTRAGRARRCAAAARRLKRRSPARRPASSSRQSSVSSASSTSSARVGFGVESSSSSASASTNSGWRCSASAEHARRAEDAARALRRDRASRGSGARASRPRCSPR